MPDSKLCLGYYDHKLQNVLAIAGSLNHGYPCAICGQLVKPIYRDNGWIPKTHCIPGLKP